MSKSRGNFYSGDQLLDEKGYAADQIRYHLALLGLSEKSSDFDFGKLDERNRFLARPLNAAFERPFSAAHSKFDGRVPDGVRVDGVLSDTVRMVQRYVKSMDRALKGDYFPVPTGMERSEPPKGLVIARACDRTSISAVPRGRRRHSGRELRRGTQTERPAPPSSSNV